MANDYDGYIDRAVEILKEQHEVHKIKDFCECGKVLKKDCVFAKALTVIEKELKLFREERRKQSED